jgi:hypothetical protein
MEATAGLTASTLSASTPEQPAAHQDQAAKSPQPDRTQWVEIYMESLPSDSEEQTKLQNLML